MRSLPGRHDRSRPALIPVLCVALGLGADGLPSGEAADVSVTPEPPAIRRIRKKLDNILIPDMEFSDVRLKEVTEFLSTRSMGLDPDGIGVKIACSEIAPKARVVNEKNEGGFHSRTLLIPFPPDERTIAALCLRDLPLSRALHYICLSTDTRWSITTKGVIITNKGAPLPAGAVKGEYGKLCTGTSEGNLSPLRKKLGYIVIPHVGLDAPFDTILNFLRKRSVELDPDGEGINFVFLQPGRELPRVKLKAENIPALDMLRRICTQVGVRFRIERYAVVIEDK